MCDKIVISVSEYQRFVNNYVSILNKTNPKQLQFFTIFGIFPKIYNHLDGSHLVPPKVWFFFQLGKFPSNNFQFAIQWAWRECLFSNLQIRLEAVPMQKWISCVGNKDISDRLSFVRRTILRTDDIISVFAKMILLSFSSLQKCFLHLSSKMIDMEFSDIRPLIEFYHSKLSQVSLDFKRYLYNKINWKARIIGFIYEHNQKHSPLPSL